MLYNPKYELEDITPLDFSRFLRNTFHDNTGEVAISIQLQCIIGQSSTDFPPHPNPWFQWMRCVKLGMSLNKPTIQQLMIHPITCRANTEESIWAWHKLKLSIITCAYIERQSISQEEFQFILNAVEI